MEGLSAERHDYIQFWSQTINTWWMSLCPWGVGSSRSSHTEVSPWSSQGIIPWQQIEAEEVLLAGWCFTEITNAASRLGGLQPAPQRGKRPSFSLSAAWRQMVFHALIFSYTLRKSRDFVSEKLHGQTPLEGRVSKLFGSLRIRQDSHFSGKLNISLKKSCVRHNPLWCTLSCLGTSQGTVYRGPDRPLSLISDHQGKVGIGKTHWNQAQRSLMGLIFRSKYYSRDVYYKKTWPAASNFPFFFPVSSSLLGSRRHWKSSIQRWKAKAQECVGQLVLFSSPRCSSL